MSVVSKSARRLPDNAPSLFEARIRLINILETDKVRTPQS